MTTSGPPPEAAQQPAPAPPAAEAPTPAAPVGAGTLSPDGRWLWDGARWVPAPTPPTAPPPGYAPPPAGYGPPPGYAPPGGHPGYGPPPGYPGYPGYAQRAAGPAPGLVYAGFWIRFAALVIDGLILTIPVVVISLAAGGFVRTDVDGTTTVNGSAYGLSILMELAYYLFFWGGMSRTPGMMALTMRIARVEDGAPIDFTKAVLRLVGFIIAYLPFGIGLIWAAFDPRKQGWHDKIAGTVVVREVRM